MSDHLKIFSDSSVTIEDILKEKGEGIRKKAIIVNETGDFEILSN